MKRITMFVAVLMTLVGLAASPAHAAGLQDFTISSFTADYYLSKDAERHSRMTVREQIVAEFPSYDQNHGLERAIPQQYDGHTVALKIKSVQKSDGSPWNYSTHTSNGNLVLRIGDADRYVHGIQTYVLTYEQQDVTRYFADTKSDELYWDTNGTEWQVPIGMFSGTFHIDSSLAGRLTSNAACYRGAAGATDRCDIARTGNDFTVRATQLSPGENVTVALGFQPETFTAYKKTLIDIIAGTFMSIVTIVLPIWQGLFVVAFAVVGWLIYRYNRLSSRSKEVGTIVPEYLPPKEASVTTAATLVTGSTATFAAQLIDFAVRHYIKIYEIDKKWIFGSKDYEIEIMKDIASLHPEEQEILRDIFAGNTVVGARLTMSSLKNNTSVYMSTLDNDKKLETLVRGEYGLRARDEAASATFKKTAKILFIAGLLTLQPAILIAAAFAWGFGYSLYPLTDKGLTLDRYLKGLKMYIQVAEAERLKMLQSPEGAEKVGAVDPNNPKQMVVLYERVLPYAILFGQEKQWNIQLGKYYESLQTQPDWYNSNGTFNAAAFGSAINNFSTASSYTSASSSSSGGSSGNRARCCSRRALDRSTST